MGSATLGQSARKHQTKGTTCPPGDDFNVRCCASTARKRGRRGSGWGGEYEGATPTGAIREKASLADLGDLDATSDRLLYVHRNPNVQAGGHHVSLKLGNPLFGSPTIIQ